MIPENTSTPPPLIDLDDFSEGLKIRWEWYRNGFIFRMVDPFMRPFGYTRHNQDDGEWYIQLVDDGRISLRASDMIEEGYHFWHARGSLDFDNAKESANSAIYQMKESENERSPHREIQQAVDNDHSDENLNTTLSNTQRIELLEGLLMEMIRDHQDIIDKFNDRITTEQLANYRDRVRAGLVALETRM